jgi:hypothetical protein
VQIDPVKPELKPSGTKLLKLKRDILVSTSAFKFNLCRYIKAAGKVWPAIYCHCPPRHDTTCISNPRFLTLSGIHPMTWRAISAGSYLEEGAAACIRVVQMGEQVKLRMTCTLQVRGLHSSTSKLNVSAVYGIGGASNV